MNALELKLAKKNREVKPESWDELYDNLVEKKIRLHYSASNEFAILRKIQKGLNVDEFEKYNEYVEKCKAEVKAELGLAEGVI